MHASSRDGRPRDAAVEGAVAAIFAPSLARAHYRATPAEGARVESALRAAGDGGLLAALRQECAAAGFDDGVAVDNAHRALLAGAQTIAATLCAALAFCAAHPPQKSLDARAAVRETLRILPPVATLPRRVETRVDVGGGIGRGAWVVGDLVACAHGGDATSLATSAARRSDDAAPWGVGPRCWRALNGLRRHGPRAYSRRPRGARRGRRRRRPRRHLSAPPLAHGRLRFPGRPLVIDPLLPRPQGVTPIYDG